MPRHVLGGQATPAPSDKLNIAGVGVGGMGKSNLGKCETENIVALCDVDFGLADPVFKKYPNAKLYKDFRVMLDEQKDIDAVIVATPDHTHAVIALAAMEPPANADCWAMLPVSGPVLTRPRWKLPLARSRRVSGSILLSPDALPPACRLVWRSRVGSTSPRSRCLSAPSARNDRAVRGGAG